MLMQIRGAVLALTLSCAPDLVIACDTDTMVVARKGKLLFNGKGVCFACHGTNGDRATASDPDIAKFNPTPTDLRNARALKYPSDEQRFDAIRNGLRGTGMPPFRGILYPEEIHEVIEYLEVLKRGGC